MWTVYNVWFSQSEVVLHSNLQNLGEKDRECSCEWLVKKDPGHDKLKFSFGMQKI